MKKEYIYICVAVALVGLAFAFFPQLFSFSKEDQEGSPRPVSIDLPTPNFSLPDFSTPGAAKEAWATWQEYLTAARAHDLSKVRSLSHQLSPACTDPAREAECFELMDSVVFFAGELKQRDFIHFASDARQTVLTTDYLEIAGSEEPIMTVIYFTQASGTYKVLGLRFCLGDEESHGQCVNTDPATRDQNDNGWWDDVEELFYK
jgi:hypothetical protein